MGDGSIIKTAVPYSSDTLVAPTARHAAPHSEATSHGVVATTGRIGHHVCALVTEPETATGLER